MTTTDVADRKAAIDQAHEQYRNRIVTCRAELADAEAEAHSALLAADLERADKAHARVEAAKGTLSAAEAAEAAIAAASVQLQQEAARLELETRRQALTDALEASYVQIDGRTDEIRTTMRALSRLFADAAGIEEQCNSLQKELIVVRQSLGEQVQVHGQPRPFEAFLNEMPLYGAVLRSMQATNGNEGDF